MMGELNQDLGPLSKNHQGLPERTYDQHPPDLGYGPTVLIVDDEPHSFRLFKAALTTSGIPNDLHVIHRTQLKDAFDLLASSLIHVILLDKNLGGEQNEYGRNGIDAIPEMLSFQPHLEIIMLTGSNAIQDVVRAMKLGASGFLTKDYPSEVIVGQVKRAADFAIHKLDRTRREKIENQSSNSLGGNSRVFKNVLRQASLLAESDRPVILFGAPGTGKTELARWIHKERGNFLKQKDRPFFAVNVSTLSSNLIEGELFGHEKGSFTGAHAAKQGFFELANNGTLFLDEIGELPLELQPKLLTVIEDGTFIRVGGSKMQKAKPKLIFATNRNLEEMVEKGQFRKDLYDRITMFPIFIPSLAERKEDIPEIVRALLPNACRENRVEVTFEEIPKDFIEHLAQMPSDSNIRGIQHQLERLLVFSPKDMNKHPVLDRWRSIPGIIMKRGSNSPSEAELIKNKTPLTYKEFISRPRNMLGGSFPGLKKAVEDFKVSLLEEAFLAHDSNRARANSLGISESSCSNLTGDLGKRKKEHE